MTPTTAFSPGYVYRQAPNGEVFFVDEIYVTPRKFEVELGGYSATFNTSGGLTANLKAPGNENLKGITAGRSNSTGSNVTFTDGNFLLITDRDEKVITQAALEIIGAPRAGDKYFIVRDVIQSKSIKMSVTRQDTITLGGEASLARLASLTPNLTVVRGQTFDVSREFQSPLNVCMRAVEIIVPDPGVPVPVIDRRPPTSTLYAPPIDVIGIFNSN